MRDHPWIGLLFTHKTGDLGATSVTERSYAAPFSKVQSHISDRFCATVNKFFGPLRGLKPAKTEVIIIQEWGLESSTPDPLGQPRWHDVRCVWTTCAAPGRCCSYYRLISQQNGNVTWRRRAQIKQMAWPIAERQIGLRKSCVVLSARFPVVNWRSRSVAKSALYRIA